MNKTKKGIVAFLLAAALLISMVGMASAHDTQTWDLDHDDIMYKTANDESGTRTISALGSNRWTADQVAQCACTFQAVNWDLTLERTNIDSGQQFKAEVGIWDGSSFTSKGNAIGSFSGTSTYLNLKISVSTFTVPKDDYLALKITEQSGQSLIVKTYLGCSHLSCPRDEPDYPVPELPTIILMSTGLLALFGYVAYRRNNKK